MPQFSRYSDQRVEQLLTDLATVLEQHKAPTDLALMVLGNMVTNLLNNSVSLAQRPLLAQSFTRALSASIEQDQTN